MENQNKEWVSIPQALKMLDITSRTTLNRFAHRHHIRVSKPSGRVYLSSADIMAVVVSKAVALGV
jgi:hypothetical protein